MVYSDCDGDLWPCAASSARSRASASRCRGGGSPPGQRRAVLVESFFLFLRSEAEPANHSLPLPPQAGELVPARLQAGLIALDYPYAVKADQIKADPAHFW